MFKCLATLTSFSRSCLVSVINIESVDGFSPNLHRYIIVSSLIADYILVTLASFSRSKSCKRYIF